MIAASALGDQLREAAKENEIDSTFESNRDAPLSRGTVTQGKRDRESRKLEKKRWKEEKRRQRREMGPQEIPVVTAESVTGRLPTVAEAMSDIERRASTPRGAAPLPARLFVGRLSGNTTSATLRAAFEAHGKVADATVVTDRFSGESRGFGFVTMADRKDSAGAISALDGSILDGNTIAVNVATDAPPRRM
jgi:hypothetical protein